MISPIVNMLLQKRSHSVLIHLTWGWHSLTAREFLSSAEYMSPVIPDSGVNVFGASENFLNRNDWGTGTR